MSTKVTCARTKAKATLNNVLPAHTVVMAIQHLNETFRSGVYTAASNHGSRKLFPV
jgi:hypothetical protein